MPMTGTPAPVWVVPSAAGHQGAHHVVAEPCLATQHAGDLVDVRRRAGDDDALLEGAASAGGVERRRSRNRPRISVGTPMSEQQEVEPARELELGQVGPDADETGGEHAGVEDPLVLVGAGTEDVA